MLKVVLLLCAFSFSLHFALGSNAAPAIQVDHRCREPPCALPKAVVSFSTIPSRLPFLSGLIKSIKSQTYPPDEIILGLPKISRREGIAYVVPEYIEKDSSIRVVWSDYDYGPATKLLPALQAVDDDTFVITVDDDGRLPRHAVHTFMEAAQLFPGVALGFTGWNTSCILDQSKCLRSRNQYHFIRQATSSACFPDFKEKYGPHHCAAAVEDLHKPQPTDVIEGFKSACYQKKLFPPEIMEILDAPSDMLSVDDVWISGVLAKAKVPRYVILQQDVPFTKVAKKPPKPFPPTIRPNTKPENTRLDAINPLHGEGGFKGKNFRMVKWFHEQGAW